MTAYSAYVEQLGTLCGYVGIVVTVPCDVHRYVLLLPETMYYCNLNSSVTTRHTMASGRTNGTPPDFTLVSLNVSG